MSNWLSTAIFCYRGYDKTVHDNSARAIPTAGQAYNLAQKVSIFDNTVGNTAKTAVEAFEMVKCDTGLFGAAAKSVEFVGKHINPFIGVATGAKILMSEDKEKAIMTDGAGFGGMLAGEYGMSKLLKSTVGKKLLLDSALQVGKVLALTNPQIKAASMIIEGLAFAGVSIGSWMAASKVGERIHNNVEDKAEKKCETKQAEEVTEKVADATSETTKEPQSDTIEATEKAEAPPVESDKITSAENLLDKAQSESKKAA